METSFRDNDGINDLLELDTQLLKLRLDAKSDINNSQMKIMMLTKPMFIRKSDAVAYYGACPSSFCLIHYRILLRF